ncbi:hypothetical protein YH64_018915 [Achromobacter sp. LC458]|uniref:Uncharacterized protein n=2 Tax=Alcaligenaceae TaxID=506 RepID=A0A2S5GLB2_9BURK|nr:MULTISPECIES: DUF6776 family protein [Achromobacter]HBL66317.1 hypothetical protein [Achromobacter sp.]PPA73724.1 hypothetical protein C4E15_23990 [Achromobacter spanius]QYJ22218.1 hypothetical protein KYT87_02830 [Achromobacter sp. ES-001]TRM51392.1 hypothetical protein YH64_018915 [Achromobacter sp. LC458]HCQ45718.1 hypothetical protein [Achromobacter sp.]
MLRIVAGLLIGVLLGGAVGYGYALRQARPPDALVISTQQAEAQAEAMRQQNAQLRYTQSQLDTADGELVIERSARQELETQLRVAQAEVGRVRDQLAFYEQLLPAGPEGSVDIRGVQIDREGGGLRYKVLLMRSGRNGGTPFAGALRFQATGVLKGETVTVDLAPMQVKAETGPVTTTGETTTAASLALQFDQYQRSQGILAVPEGFVPESVTVSVLEGETVRASRSVKLEL